MTDLREDFAIAGSPHSSWTQRRIRDADVKLGALGMADALGAALWRLKYKGDKGVARRALALMAERLRTEGRWQRIVHGRARVRRVRGANCGAVEHSADLVDRLVARVLAEWINDRCATCRGRGSLGRVGAVLVCTTCRGSGRELMPHAARWRDLGVTREQYYARWQEIIDSLLCQLAVIDEEVHMTLKSQIQMTPVNRVAERRAA